MKFLCLVMLAACAKADFRGARGRRSTYNNRGEVGHPQPPTLEGSMSLPFPPVGPGIGGVNALPREIPWEVSVRRYGEHWCGGTLISNQHVLTAAHCFDQGPNTTSSWTIGYGTIDLFAMTNEHRRNVHAVIKHGGYRSVYQGNDLTILKLQLPVGGGIMMSLFGGPVAGVGGPVAGVGGPVGEVEGPVAGVGGLVGEVGGPVAGVGGPVAGVGGPVAGVGGPVAGVGGPVAGVGGPVVEVGGPVAGVGGPVAGVGGPVGEVGGPVAGVGGPVAGVGGPVVEVGGPVAGVGGPVGEVGGPVAGVGGPVAGVLRRRRQLGGPYFQIAALPVAGANFENTMCAAAGWGDTAYGGNISRILQKVKIPIISNTVCISYKGYETRVHQNVMCASGADGKGPCSGDSGGSLTCRNSQGQEVLAGVVSWGYKCQLNNHPAVFTRVSNYLGWINRVISMNPAPGFHAIM